MQISWELFQENLKKILKSRNASPEQPTEIHGGKT